MPVQPALAARNEEDRRIFGLSWASVAGARPNRILNRYDRKRERDRGQSAFCVPIDHFLLLPIQRVDRRVTGASPFPILRLSTRRIV